MHKISEWIVGALRAVVQRLKVLGALVWNVLCSAVTWIVAAIAYVFDQVAGWINGAISDGLDILQDSLGSAIGEVDSFDVSPLAAYYLNLFHMSDAVSLLVTLLGLWVVARVARLAMIPVRAVLEVL